MMDRIVYGWLILDSITLKPLELELGQADDEPPYSNDEGVLQFHLKIDFITEYPKATVLP